jgi:PadR family transcriptional regulator, regulatory protein PadR
MPPFHVGDENLRDKRRTQILKGIVELALLSLLSDGPEYGLKILDSLRDSAGLDLAEGTLYPLLYRLEKGGLIKAEWRMVNEASHPRKYYALTPEGAAELKAQISDWLALTRKLNAFLNRK